MKAFLKNTPFEFEYDFCQAATDNIDAEPNNNVKRIMISKLSIYA
jgi:hypothetical protein